MEASSLLLTRAVVAPQRYLFRAEMSFMEMTKEVLIFLSIFPVVFFLLIYFFNVFNRLFNFVFLYFFGSSILLMRECIWGMRYAQFFLCVDVSFSLIPRTAGTRCVRGVVGCLDRRNRHVRSSSRNAHAHCDISGIWQARHCCDSIWKDHGSWLWGQTSGTVVVGREKLRSIAQGNHIKPRTCVDSMAFQLWCSVDNMYLLHVPVTLFIVDFKSKSSVFLWRSCRSTKVWQTKRTDAKSWNRTQGSKTSASAPYCTFSLQRLCCRMVFFCRGKHVVAVVA